MNKQPGFDTRNALAGLCDKCGRPVYKGNSALHLAVAAGEMRSVSLIVCSTRHIFPSEGCEGSPSRRTLIVEDCTWARAFVDLGLEFPLSNRQQVEPFELAEGYMWVETFTTTPKSSS